MIAQEKNKFEIVVVFRRESNSSFVSGQKLRTWVWVDAAFTGND